jgi:CRP-like cAMP-binding protein
LADRAVLRRYRPGQTIIEQDSQGDSMFLIGKGTAQVKLRHPDGTVARVGTLVRGDFFGEVSMLTGEKRLATVLTETEVEAFEISKECLEPILTRNPNLAEELSRTLAAHQALGQAQLSSVPQPSTPRAADAAHASNLRDRIRSFFKLRH